MDSDKIRILLQKYYLGETSLEEEKILKQYLSEFSQAEFANDKQLVDYYLSSQITVPGDLNEELDDLIENEWKKETKGKFYRIIRWSSSVAALLIIALSIFFYSKKENQTALADTYKDPRVAYAETQKVLLFISNTMNRKAASLKYLSNVDNSFGQCGKLSKINETLNSVKK
jgi:hypothetical protein